MLCVRLEPEQGYHNMREAAISHGRIRRSTQSHTEEHERIRRFARGANNKRRNSGFKDNGSHERKGNPACSVYVCF